MRNTQRHAVIESMETRRLMSLTPATDAIAPEPDAQTALLLPAVQAAREAAKASPSSIMIVKKVDVASPNLMQATAGA